MSVQTQEARVILAIEAIRTSKKLSRRAAAKIYNVPEATLRHRMNGRIAFDHRRPGLQNLTELEEEVIVQYVLDLDSRGFPCYDPASTGHTRGGSTDLMKGIGWTQPNRQAIRM